MSPRPAPGDQAERERAIRSTRNVAVTAGAGTGKTTLLVSRIAAKVEAGVPVDRVLALTFTEKAANEMRIRLRRELQEIGKEKDLERAGMGTIHDKAAKEKRIRLPRELRETGKEKGLERAEIGTIHSFCAHVLRQFPVEAGVAPDFEVDEGHVFRRRFEEAWPRWLDRELGPKARRPRQWQELLAKVDLASVRDLAEALASFSVPLEGGDGSALLAGYVKELAAKVPKLAPALRGEAEPQKTIKGGALEKGALKLAQDVARIDAPLAERALGLARDFALGFRRDFLKSGWITFDGILVRVLELLKDPQFPGVRKILRERFDAVLVDEVQDTDPVQGEIIRLLCEDEAGKLVPGKLFLVGDPKQSIYGFRGADIIAYQGLVDEVLRQGGERVVLRTNFRSHAGILDFVNGAFERVIRANGSLQPAYEAIEPAADAKAEHEVPAIQAVLVEGATAGESREVEARELAAWIAKRPEGLRYKDVAVLLRSLVDVGTYLDALRGAGIPYVVEGEKHFYGTTEVVDFVNVLRAVANPHDRLAVAGVLRSPYGAVPDAELYERRASLDYREPSPWPVFARLKAWNEDAGRRGVTELLGRILEESHALEIARAGIHGEQAVANLLKLKATAQDLESKGGCTLREFLDAARQAVRELEEEGESPLADETLDAVKVMSIHRAKGLEFPVVVLPDLHRGRAARREPVVQYDQTSGTLGVRLGEVMNAGGAALAHLGREREREEWRRLLYVACTRPEQVLVLMGGTEAAGEESFLALLEEDFEAGVEVRKVPYERPAFRPAARAEAAGPADWPGFLEAWARREAASSPPAWLTSPTRLEDHDKATPLELPEGPRGSSRGVEIGIACHEVLERLDFARPELPEGTDPEAAAILEKFFRSAAFKELAGAEILARELPFLIPHGARAVQGVVDVVYRKGGKLVVADYKTDTIVKPELHEGAARIYAEAVRRALGEDPVFKLIYLRQGRIVAL